MSSAKTDKSNYSITEKEIGSESKEDVNKESVNKDLTLIYKPNNDTEYIEDEAPKKGEEIIASCNPEKEAKVEKLTKEFEALTTNDTSKLFVKKRQQRNKKRQEKKEHVSGDVEDDGKKTKKIYRRRKYYRKPRKPIQENKDDEALEDFKGEHKKQQAKQGDEEHSKESRNLEKRHKSRYYYGRRKYSGRGYGNWHNTNVTYVHPDRSSENERFLGEGQENMESIEFHPGRGHSGFGPNPFSRPRRNENRGRKNSRQFSWGKKQHREQDHKLIKAESTKADEEDKENMPTAA